MDVSKIVFYSAIFSLFSFFIFFGKLFIYFLIAFFRFQKNKRKDKRLSMPFGVCGIVGRFGSGKTTFLSFLSLQKKRKYKNAFIVSNFGLAIQDFRLENLEDLTRLLEDLQKYYKNGGEIRPVYIFIDEIQNIFDSRNWGNLPSEITALFTQVRKFHISIYYTTQVAGFVDSRLRDLTKEIIEIRSVFGFLAFSTTYPTVDYLRVVDAEKPKKRKFLTGKNKYLYNQQVFLNFQSYEFVESLKKTIDC